MVSRKRSVRPCLALTISFGVSLLASCDPSGNEAEQSQSTSSAEPKAETGSSSGSEDSGPSSSNADNSGPQDGQEPGFELLSHSSQGEGCIIKENGGNATAILTNSRPDGPKDYAQWTFDALDVPSDNEQFEKACELRLRLKWTPGYRVRAKGFEVDLSANADSLAALRKTSEASPPSLGVHLSFSNRPSRTDTLRIKDFSGDGELGLVMGADMSSDCSGQGEWVAKLKLTSKSSSDTSEVRLAVDQASVIFDLLKDQSLEKCP